VRPGYSNVVATLTVPVLFGERLLGVLHVHTTQPDGHFSADDLRRLQMLAAQAAIAIENARLFAEAKRASAALEWAQAERLESEKLRALGQISAGIAHDLNNTLAAVLGQTELLKLRVTDPGIQGGLATLETAAADGAHVVRRLQDFARPRGTSPQAAIDLTKVIQEVLELTRPRWKDDAQRRRAPVEVVTCLEACPPVQGHAPELREALINLILNAVDAMPTGGILTVATRSGSEAIELEVTDTGVGMTEEVRWRIFEPFFTTKGLHGTGLGLSVVYGIVERHGGRITVNSTPGKGTTFCLQFPKATGTPTKDSEPAPRTSAEPRTLLLVDDEKNVRETLSQLLSAVGHTVLEAESGPRGLELLRDHTVHCVLTDLGMPGMTGWDVARAVKRLQPNIPVVLLTGWGEQVQGESDERGAVDRILGKPVRLAELRRILHELTAELPRAGV
jgi:signal transduction histidine kinase/CheY-like chemotaxis protein